MMFTHKHYVPIVKGKRGEFPAIDGLHSKDHVSPLIEHVPSQDLDFIPKKMDAIWPKENPYFIDMLFVDDEDNPADGANNHPLTKCFNVVAQKSQRAIPVTGPTRSPGYQEALKRIVASQQKGFAIRLTIEDFDDDDSINAWIDAIPSFTNTSPLEIDAVIDLGGVSGQTAAVIARNARTLMSMLSRINEWRTLTVVSGAFPPGLAPLSKGWNTVPRNDWGAWLNLIKKQPKMARLPSYGDYTIAHPGLPAEGRATILAQLRYSTPSDFLIFKGDDVFTHKRGFSQFCDLCAQFVKRPEYRGQNFSLGDLMIFERSTRSDSCGNAETWRTIGVNHHVETVLDQIANLP